MSCGGTSDRRAEYVQSNLESLANRLVAEAGSIVVAGDSRPCDSVTRLARGADILSTMCRESGDIVDGCELANETGLIRGAADARQLVVDHIGELLNRPDMRGARGLEARQTLGRSHHPG